jgi:hypothetical protein
MQEVQLVADNTKRQTMGCCGNVAYKFSFKFLNFPATISLVFFKQI